jgi:peptidoglycan/xylan/chitin deacetylase (PgdA/CDA1 family)
MGVMASPLRDVRTLVFKLIDMTGIPQASLGHTSSTIVLYHGVTQHKTLPEEMVNYRGKFIEADAFAKHIEWLKTNFTILPLADLIERANQGRAQGRALAITFDDGYQNNYTDAYPILKAAGVPATFFITTGFIEGEPLWVDRLEFVMRDIATDLATRQRLKTLPRSEVQSELSKLELEAGKALKNSLAQSPYAPMTWEQMREMEQGGMTFAPHTATHPILSRQSAEDQEKEIISSYETLKLHLNPLKIFAYPNGGEDDFNEDTVRILKSAGFTASLTTHPGRYKGGDPYKIPRYTLDGANDLPRLKLIVSGLYNKLV